MPPKQKRAVFQKKCHGTLFDPEKRLWISPLAQRRSEKSALKKLLKIEWQVERAKSSRSTCRRCGCVIDKSEFRMAYPCADHRAEYGCMPSWLHMGCAASVLEQDDDLAKGWDLDRLDEIVYGYSALSKKDKATFREQIMNPEEYTTLEVIQKNLRPKPIEMEPPTTVKAALFPFQKEGLSWMVEQENNPKTRGGILGDEMGMGKTLQAICTMLMNVKVTLVVCPSAAVLQWRNEILRFADGNLKPIVYHGEDRNAMLKNLTENTVVITTYQTMECEYRRIVKRYKRKCEWCDRMFLPDKLGIHQKYFCGPTAERSSAQKKTSRKDDAVKMMKIGGSETNIQLHYPLTALRSVMRKDMKKPQSGHKRPFMHIPLSTLPEDGIELLLSVPKKSKKAGVTGDDKATVRNQSATGSGAASSTEGAQHSVKEEVERKKLKCIDLNSDTDAEDKKNPIARKRVFSRKRTVKPEHEAKAEHETKAEHGAKTEHKVKVEEGPPRTWGKKLKTSKAVVELHAPEKRCIDLTDSLSGSDDDLKLVGGMAPKPTVSVEDWGCVDLSSSRFFSQKWGRVVLDEAHRIKSRTNSTATAAYCLQSDIRWCISGTPIQNKIGELYSLVRFLQFYPYAHYRCMIKGCTCESLHYRFDSNARCSKCNHIKMVHASVFQRHIAGPIMKYGDIGLGQVAFTKLKHQVMDKIFLRRTKLERADDLNLPEMHVRIRKDELSKEEMDFYNSMFRQCVTEFDTYVDSGTLLHNYAHVFDLLMRLRQAVDHPYLVVHGSLNAKLPTKSRVTKSLGVCALCQDGIQSGLTAKCGHNFHKACVEEFIAEAPVLASGGVGCPACFNPLTIDFDDEIDFADDIMNDGVVVADQRQRKKTPSIMDRIDPDNFQSSTKIEALVSEIKDMMEKDKQSKALVFSQFIRMLDLVEWRLKREFIGCTKINGSINIQARNNIIMDFNTNPNSKVLLISLKAGGEGLNLQAADHVFIMDPWWNPAAELQAMQRAHRIGQTRRVTCTRFFAANTIEDRIMSLQNKKQIAFDVTINNKTEALGHLTSDDLLFLFQR
eukprot:GEMP01007308.1.p1 GENE.GEMP01007308.1~~GEMP01007308.1.p1  ORF type:complete len:1073 (+),score=208.45 GEMP01007308.1:45-3221(+)